MNSVLATKDLDLHLLTSRIAAMSCPTEGMDLSSYKNAIDDIRQILEARHSGRYAVFNLAEKKYAATKFPTGRVVDAGWTASVPPSVEELLEVSTNCENLYFVEFFSIHPIPILGSTH